MQTREGHADDVTNREVRGRLVLDDDEWATVAGQVPSGVWAHYGGGRYFVVGVALHTESGEPMVVYTRLYSRPGPPMFVRPAAMFLEEVTPGTPRFRYLGHLDDGQDQRDREL